MEKRRLGKTDLELTVVGLGTWAIAGGEGWQYGWGPQDEGEAVAGILRGIDLGINWVDTAPVYGGGSSEELVAHALRELGPARHPLIATKCGRLLREDGSIRGDLSAESIRAECEASLKRLGIETIDLYQMHWPDPDEAIEDGWAAMAALVKEGKVRHIGVSNFDVAQLRRLQPIHRVASLQPPYSMIVRGAEDELLPFCARHGIGVVAYSPMCKGLLTGTFSRERAAQLPADDHRRLDPKFNDPQLGVHLELVDGLGSLAQRYGRTPAQLAIAWVLRKPGVTSAIVGTRRPEQIESTAAAADWRLTPSELAEIDGHLDAHAEALQELGDVDTGRV